MQRRLELLGAGLLAAVSWIVVCVCWTLSQNHNYPWIAPVGFTAVVLTIASGVIFAAILLEEDS